MNLVSTKTHLPMSFIAHLTTESGKPLVQVRDGEVYTTSTLVAEFFGKRHDNVKATIESWLAEIPSADHSLTFKEMIGEVEIGKGATRDAVFYEITEAGFALLGNSFTGAMARKFKLAYVRAFELMRREIHKLQQERLEIQQEQIELLQKSLNTERQNIPKLTAEISRMSNLVDSAERLERKTEDLQDTIDTLRSENRELGEKLDHVNPGKATVLDVQRKTERRILSDYTKMINKKANRVAREIKGVRKWAANAGYAGEIVLETHLGNIETELQPFTY